jgi:hypothetical protein
MKSFWDYLNLTLALGGFLITAVSLVAAYYFYVRSQQCPRLSVRKNSHLIVGRPEDEKSEIEISFQGRRVGRISKEIIVIWNSGNTILSGDQIVANDPLRIVLPENGEMLGSPEVIKESRAVNSVRVVLREDSLHEAVCIFDFLEPGEGAIIKALHTGRGKVEVKGTLRGMPKGVSDHGWLNLASYKPPLKLALIPLAVAGFSALTILGALWSIWKAQALLLASAAIVNAALLFVLASFIAYPTFYLRWNYLRESSSRPPNALVQERE